MSFAMSESPRRGELEASQQTIKFFETLLRASADGIVITDATQSIIVVNEAFCDFFGRRWRDVVETSLFVWLEQLDPGAPRRWVELEQRVRLEGSRRNVEFRLTTKDGVRHLSANVSLLKRVADEEAGVIISTWRDITERKRAEEALRESEERFRNLAQTATDAIISIGADARVRFFNRAAERIFGCSAEEMMGQEMTALIPEEYGDRHVKAIRRYVETRQPRVIGRTVELSGLRKGGEIFPIELSLAEATIGGEIIFTGIIRDITERKRAEEELQEYSERLEEMVEERTRELRDAQEQLVRREKLAVLGQLAGMVAHELRNPLATISNAVFYLKIVLPDAEETVKEYLEIIAQTVRDSDKIISDLLDFSRTRAPDRREVAVSEMVAEVLAKRPPPENVEVTTQLAPNLPPVYVDRRQMRQVLGNLVTNAYQAMSEGGVLTIGAQAKEGAVSLSIADTGMGITEENMAKLFEPLFTTKVKGLGLGLGLMVVKSLVEANEGSIEVESEVGKGSTFMVRLPYA